MNTFEQIRAVDTCCLWFYADNYIDGIASRFIQNQWDRNMIRSNIRWLAKYALENFLFGFSKRRSYNKARSHEAPNP